MTLPYPNFQVIFILPLKKACLIVCSYQFIKIYIQGLWQVFGLNVRLDIQTLYRVAAILIWKGGGSGSFDRPIKKKDFEINWDN